MRQLRRNTLISAVDTFVLIGVNVLLTAFLLKNLGGEKYGLYVFLSIFSFNGALSFADLGMEGAIVSLVARCKERFQARFSAKVLQTAVLYYSGLALVSSVIVRVGIKTAFSSPIVSVVQDVVAEKILHLLAVNIFLQFISTPVSAVLQGLKRYDFVKMLNIVLTVVQSLGFFLIISLGGDLVGVFSVSVAVSLFRLIALYYIVAMVLKLNISIGYNRSVFRLIWRSGNILFVNRIIGLVYNTADKIVLTVALPMANLATYDVCSRPPNAIKLLGGISYSSIIPEVAALHANGDYHGVQNLYNKIFRLVVGMLTPICCALILNSHTILLIWIGESFAANWHFMSLLVLSVTLNVLSSLISTIAVGIGVVGKTFYIPTVATIIRIIVGVALVSTLGVFGLVLGFFVGEVIMLTLYLRLFNKEFHLGTPITILDRKRMLAMVLVTSLLHGANVSLGLPVHVWMVGFFLVLGSSYAIIYVLFKKDFDQIILYRNSQ